MHVKLTWCSLLAFLSGFLSVLQDARGSSQTCNTNKYNLSHTQRVDALHVTAYAQAQRPVQCSDLLQCLLPVARKSLGHIERKEKTTLLSVIKEKLMVNLGPEPIRRKGGGGGGGG